MPCVSIVVTAYNIEKYIAESLACITGQTLQDIEIIVVDDGSTDGTPQIIHDFAAKDPRIKPILFEKNTIGGVATAANAGMDVATGDFIGFADGDDRYAPDMFEKLWRAATAADADLAMCRYMLLDQSDGQLKEPTEVDRWRPYPNQTVLTLDLETRKEILRFVSVPWRKLYRRDLVERSGLRYPVGDFFYEDNPFHWAAVTGAERIVLVPERLCDHRVARVGQTMATVDERLLRIFQHHDIIRGQLERSGHLAEYRGELLRWLSAQLAWVSQRAEGGIRRQLFDILVPILANYDAADLAAFQRSHGRSRTAQMLEALKAADFKQFSKAAGWEAKARPVTRASSGKSLFGWGIYYLREAGVRRTASMTAAYLSKRLGLRRKAPQPVVQERLTNQDLMMAMIVLQRDLRALRHEIRALRQSDKPEP